MRRRTAPLTRHRGRSSFAGGDARSMNSTSQDEQWPTEAGVRADLERQPHLFMRLAENALTVAESLRDNYFKNTAQFVSALRKAMRREEPVLRTFDVADTAWSEVQGEVVTFIDGGVGQVRISSQVPILLRVGSYCVRTGERRLAEREAFGYYPIVLGDLEGGTKTRKDFIDIVRITAELLGGLAALERTPDLDVLMFHGPLVYLVGSYAGHTPFTERDIDLFLGQYGHDATSGRDMKEDFLHEARLDIYSKMTQESDDWSNRRVFEPLAWIAYLYRRLIRTAAGRDPVPVISGVVERGTMREFIQGTLLDRVFRGLRANGRADYFNLIYGRSDLTSSEALLDRLGYRDALLLAMLMRPGEYSESWEMIGKYEGLREGSINLPGDSRRGRADWSALRPPNVFGFPKVHGCYVHVSDVTEPIRVEVFPELGDDQVERAARRAYLYARLLPGYGFPVGLDIADKYAHVPTWLTDAYSKLIRYHLSVSLQRGEITDAQMQRLLVQAIYMTHRDWLFRPGAEVQYGRN
jgi:NurA domain-containing protein